MFDLLVCATSNEMSLAVVPVPSIARLRCPRDTPMGRSPSKNGGFACPKCLGDDCLRAQAYSANALREPLGVRDNGYVISRARF
jgi:hypothetical protein